MVYNTVEKPKRQALVTQQPHQKAESNAQSIFPSPEMGWLTFSEALSLQLI